MTTYRNLTPEQYENIMDDCEDETFKVIQHGEWISEGKYEYLEVIVQDKHTEQFYSVNQSRSGSYFSDYEYEKDLEAILVKPREITKIVYEVA